MDILRGDVFQVDLIDAGAVVHVFGHVGRGGDVVQSEGGISCNVRCVEGGCGKAPAAILLAHCFAQVNGLGQATGVDLLHLLHDLEQTGTAGDAVGLQRGRHRQADGLFRAGGIGHHQVGGERIQAALHAFYRGIEALQVDGGIDAAFGQGTAPPLQNV